MKLQIKVLSGARSGITAVFSASGITVGRHHESTLSFDAEQDLDVSGRHAVFVREEGRWLVRDLGSRNGTIVNGHRITRDTKLDDTDQIRFGEDGPRVEIRLVNESTPDKAPEPAAAPARRAPRPTGAAPPRESVEPQRRSSTTQRIRIEVGRQTRRLRAMTRVLFVVLLAVAAIYFVDNRRQLRQRERDVAAMQARIDSILDASQRAVAMLRGQVEGLENALLRSQTDVQRLQRNLAVAEAAGNDEEVEALRQELATATAAFRSQQLAAQVDYTSINEANQFAVAMIWADLGNGIRNGTAFAVTADGVLITNKHVVAGDDGSLRPRRLAVQFTNSAQVFRADLIALSDNIDIAVVQVRRLRGQIPTIQGFADPDASIGVGEPVAVIGFPLGDDLPMRSGSEADIIRTTFTAGTVSKVLPDLLQIDGYGAPGASGSPIFNSDGDLVGVLYAGQEGTNGRVVYSVPAAFVQDLLRQIGR